MEKRFINGHAVTAIGLGCMNLSHAYDTPPEPAQAAALIHKAFDLGIDCFDTAALYGFGANEKLLGPLLKPHRQDIFLASKCGMTGVDGKRVIDGRPETLKKTCEESLTNLQTDHLDLYYLHRWDKSVPIEDSVGALGDLVREGKIGSIGLSEVSARTLRRAHDIHPIAAVQSEYSLWSRNPEISVLSACRELGTTFVAFSPLARAYLTGTLTDVDGLKQGDIRRAMPRFAKENYARNLKLLDVLETLSQHEGCTKAQLALAWSLSKGNHIIPIPGTRNPDHLRENMGACKLTPSAQTIETLDQTFAPTAISGSRYNEATLAEIDSEDFS